MPDLTTTSRHYGDELSLRLADIRRLEPLEDPAQLSGPLRRPVDAIGMPVLAGPLEATEDGDETRAGASAVVILAESHAAVHAYPGMGQLFPNVFSCKPYDKRTVLGVLEAALGHFAVLERHKARRGYDWPGNIERAQARWRAHRDGRIELAGLA